ncbi:Signal recognition particle core component [Peltigera leucophlebia]|nr:Signal recognition particle core component [Peltigera leucophlebia]
MATASHSLTALLKQTTIDDHEAVLKACNVTLKQSKGDLQVLHTKSVALLKLDRYDDALRALEEGGDRLKDKAGPERAYALYKLNELEQARTVAESVLDNRGARHVEAQASYRLEDFPRAAAIYKDLEDSQATIENEENDLRINGGAADAQLEWRKQGYLAQRRKPASEDMDAFETAYNAACGSIARGEFGRGEVLLRRAKDLCNALNELSEEEKIAERLPISVQQVYVLKKLRKFEEAERVASELSVEDIPDLSTRQIAQINKLALESKPSNPFLSHRLFESAHTLPKTDKPFQFQADLIKQNGLTLDLLTLKSSGVISSTSKILSSSLSPTASSHVNHLAVINAAAHAQSELGKLGLKKILPLLKKRPKDIGLILTIVQLYILTQNPGSATTVLETLLKRLSEPPVEDKDQDILHSPGLIATLISLYSSQNRHSQIKSTLAKAASYWRHKSKPPVSLLQAAGLSLLTSSSSPSSSPEVSTLATEIFSTLHAADPSCRVALAGFVAAKTSSVSPSTTFTPPQPETDKLTAIPRLVAGIDVDDLEASGVPFPAPSATSSSNTTKAGKKRALDEAAKPAKKRVRKSTLRKDYEQGKAPDPERWLPLRDRSTYRPKGRKGRAKAAFTQGGVVDKVQATSGGGKAGEVVKPAVNPGLVVGAGGKSNKGKGKKGKK